MESTVRSPVRGEQFNLRLRTRELATIRQAAEASGRYMSEIVRDAAVREARRVLRRADGA